MNEKWYVLRSKPHKELFLAGELLTRNFEVFCPVLYVKPVNPRARKIKPYFPGYLFIYTDLQSANLSSLSWMPGTVGLVTFGAEPAFVPDELVRAIRKKVDAHLRKLGFSYITLDLKGYRTGSMNETLTAIG